MERLQRLVSNLPVDELDLPVPVGGADKTTAGSTCARITDRPDADDFAPRSSQDCPPTGGLRVS